MNDPANAFAGINLAAVQGSFIQDNIVTGTGINGNDNTGIRIFSSPGNAYCCNILNNIRLGVHVIGGSTSTDNFKGNTFNTHQTGLRLENSGLLGAQQHTGNCWQNGGSAEWDGVSQQYAGLFPFIVDPTINTCLRPAMVTPAQGWFENFPDNGQTFACLEGVCELEGFNHESDDAKRIAGGTIDAGTYTNAVRWALGRYLYKNAYGLPTNEAIIQAFFSSHQHSTIGRFYALDSGLSNLYDGNASERDAVKAGLDSLALKMEELSALDKQLLSASEPYWLELMAARTLLLNDIRILIGNVQSDYQLITQNHTQAAGTLKSQNAGITVQHIYEQNEKAVNEAFLAYLGRAATHFTGSEKQLLEDIAAQCPLSGGKAVFEARALLAIESGQLAAYDDDNLCNSGGAFYAPPANGHTESEAIKLYPNPAKQQTLVKWGSPLENRGALKVFDAFGKVLTQSHLIEGSISHRLSLEDLSNGVYFLHLNLDGEEHTLKLIVN